LTPSAPAGRAVAALPGAGARAADFGRRLWAKMAHDDVLFLASGVAFNILLASVPFFLLLASAIGYALGTSHDVSNGAAVAFIRDLFPLSGSGADSVLDPVMRDIVRTRGAAGVFGALAYIWFSTRLFGSLRAVFNTVFDVPKRHSILIGKLFDIWFTVAATALVIAWIAASAYVAVARSRGMAFLASVGMQSESFAQGITYYSGRFVTFLLLGMVFFALYKALPYRVVRSRQAAFGAAASAILFEVARGAFTLILHRWNPATLYTGTLAAIVIVVFWVYYGALIVIVGGEVSQVHERASGPKATSAPARSHP